MITGHTENALIELHLWEVQYGKREQKYLALRGPGAWGVLFAGGKSLSGLNAEKKVSVEKNW